MLLGSFYTWGCRWLNSEFPNFTFFKTSELYLCGNTVFANAFVKWRWCHSRLELTSNTLWCPRRKGEVTCVRNFANPRTQETETGRFGPRPRQLGYIAKPCLKKVRTRARVRNEKERGQRKKPGYVSRGELSMTQRDVVGWPPSQGWDCDGL